MTNKRMYPVYVHKEEGSAYGVTILDLPGCFTAGDTLDEALANVQEAVELYLEDASEAPEPGSLEGYIANPEYAGGIWVLAQVNLDFLLKRRVRINITLPESVLLRIDAEAAHRGLTRSGFLVQAAEKEIIKEAC